MKLILSQISYLFYDSEIVHQPHCKGTNAAFFPTLT